eukprot:8995452-Ditylum_brightwellii.AAC.1
MITAFQNGKIKSTAFDVTTMEHFLSNSPMWILEHVLLTLHNAERTTIFFKEATEMFLEANLPGYLRGLNLPNHVDEVA